MNARTALLEQWRKVLVFSLGDDRTFSFSQIPDLQRLPQRLPLTPEYGAGFLGDVAQSFAAQCLGEVLAIAALKLHRDFGDPELIDGVDWSLWTVSICESLREERLVLPYRAELCSSYLHILGATIELAMLAPDRLPALHARLDAIDNAELHRLAMEAVQGVGSDDLMADLLRPAEVAP